MQKSFDLFTLCRQQTVKTVIVLSVRRGRGSCPTLSDCLKRTVIRANA